MPRKLAVGRQEKCLKLKGVYLRSLFLIGQKNRTKNTLSCHITNKGCQANQRTQAMMAVQCVSTKLKSCTKSAFMDLENSLQQDLIAQLSEIWSKIATEHSIASFLKMCPNIARTHHYMLELWHFDFWEKKIYTNAALRWCIESIYFDRTSLELNEDLPCFKTGLVFM